MAGLIALIVFIATWMLTAKFMIWRGNRFTLGTLGRALQYSLVGWLTSLILIAMIGGGIDTALKSREAKRLATDAGLAGFHSHGDQMRARAIGIDNGRDYYAHLASEEMKAQRAAEQAQREQRALERQAEIEAERQCRQDPQCWGHRYEFAALRPCRKAVESLAKYDYRWTDGWLDVKFPEFRVLDSGQITYLGNNIQFQNGFGAWQTHSYHCTYDPVSKSVTDAQALPGR